MNATTIPTISISADALSLINREAQRSADGLETGGILLGTETHGNISIRHAGDPGPNARRHPRNFVRDLHHAQQLATAAWREDHSQWIGEWHTHPSSDLTPSSLDLDSYLRHLHDPELQLDRFVAIIVEANASGRVRSATWLVDLDRIYLVNLQSDRTIDVQTGLADVATRRPLGPTTGTG
jgi:integrative and conjugative element protein (TIGR02256 family)